MVLVSLFYTARVTCDRDTETQGPVLLLI